MASLLLLCAPANAHAVEPRLGVDLAYFGDLITRPGALARGQLTFGRGHHRLALAVELGTFVHPGDDVGLFLGASVGYRVVANFGLFGELSAGVGWLQTFLDGDVYAPSANGGVAQVRDGGHAAFMPSVSAAIGWDLSQRRIAPIALFLRPRVFWQYPYNTQWLLHGAVEVGVTWWFR